MSGSSGRSRRGRFPFRRLLIRLRHFVIYARAYFFATLTVSSPFAPRSGERVAEGRVRGRAARREPLIRLRHPFDSLRSLRAGSSPLVEGRRACKSNRSKALLFRPSRCSPFNRRERVRSALLPRARGRRCRRRMRGLPAARLTCLTRRHRWYAYDTLKNSDRPTSSSWSCELSTRSSP